MDGERKERKGRWYERDERKEEGRRWKSGGRAGLRREADGKVKGKERKGRCERVETLERKEERRRWNSG